MSAAPSTGLWLIRHGETEWSKSGQHTGRTDLPLTDLGREQAAGLRRGLGGVQFAAIVTSPRLRARATCELAGCADRPGLPPVIDADLAEWDYGAYEGLTSAEIHRQARDWSLWAEGAPGGESPEAICARVDRLLLRWSSVDGEVALFGHGHVLRVVALRFLGWPLSQGGQLALDTATVGRVSTAGGRRVLQTWNRRP